MIVNPCDPELLYAVLQVCFMFTTLMLFYNPPSPSGSVFRTLQACAVAMA